MSIFYRLGIILSLLILVPTIMAQEDSNADNTVIIEAYDADLNTLLPSLELNGIIPSGGVEAFTQGRSTFAGDNAQFSTFAIDNTSQNVIMGLAINFIPQADTLEFCGLGLHTQRTEENRYDDESGSNIATIRLDRYLSIGIDNEGTIFVVERGEDANPDLFLSDTTLPLAETVYILATLLNNQLTLFANGILVLDEYDVDIPAGGFAFLYAGADEDSSCETISTFAYTFNDDLVDACIISTDSPINQRSGAGTNFERVTQLQAGSPLEAIGQTIGTDGFTWWLLEDDTWVREDVVNADGFCRVLPTIEASS